MHDQIPESVPTPRSSRAAIHDSPVHFRAHAPLVDAGKALAARRGMSLAELMRHALRREVDAAGEGAGLPKPVKLTEQPSLVRRAAEGDLNAQREALTNELLSGHANPALWPEALRWAEVWARLAAAHGDAQDHGRLLTVLGMCSTYAQTTGDVAKQRRLDAESIAITSVLADEGNERAATALAAFSGEADADLMTYAQAFVASWKAAV